MTAKVVNLELENGETFQRLVRWETAPRVWRPITGITQAAPVVVTCVEHAVPDGWKVGVTNVKGMLDINAGHTPPRDGEMLQATYMNVDHLALNDISSADFDAYESGGYIMYWTPHDLLGYTAALVVRDQPGGTLLATIDGDAMLVNDSAKTISITVSATATEAFDWEAGVYDLEMTSPDGVVTAILTGEIRVGREL